MTLHGNTQNESSLTACEVREEIKDLMHILDCASSKTPVHENETFEEMTKDLPPCYASPSCTKTREGRYRRRSIERRGAISHLLNLSTSQRDEFLLPSAQSSSDIVFARPLTDRSTNRSITTTVLSSKNKDHSALYSSQGYPPYTASTSCNKRNITEEVNCREATFFRQRKKHELPVSSSYDNVPFDAQQLRKEWEYRRSLQGSYRPKEEQASTKQRTTRALVAKTPEEWFLPTKSAVSDTQQSLSETAAICSLDTDRNSSLRLANQSNLDVKSSFLFPANHQDKIIPEKPSPPTMLVFSEKSKSAPHLLTGETNIPRCTNEVASATDFTQEKNRPVENVLFESKSVNKMPKSLLKENMTPLFKRMSHQSGDIFTGMVHASLFRLERLLQKKEKEDRNILFEEMKKFDEQNLLKFVKGGDTYYAP